MQSLLLTLAYEGTDYAGWQVQPGRRTVQGELQRALAAITGAPSRVIGSGRTDAGVHALGQAAAFQTSSTFAPEVFQRALNALLPRDIAVLQAAAVAPDFHPIRDAIKKRYRYVVRDGPVRDVFARRHAWHYRQRLDADAMGRAAAHLLGRHDFSSFETAGAPRPDRIRCVSEIFVRRSSSGGRDQIILEVEADGFLYNMVRAIVGTLVEVGRGARKPAWVADVLAATDRGAAGPTAPPQGLFLVEVKYPDHIYISQPPP